MAANTTAYNFKRTTAVPTAKELVDVVLSKTQRKTPTEIHKQYDISRIRRFYMRKCKFAQQSFHDKLAQILTEFPKLDDVHPFYADLMNVLYDRDHYKLALGQINSINHQIDNIAKDYVRMLKFGDSLYRCKQLKRACLGRICTMVLRLNGALTYLEQVRQHLARLPSIDPNTRTLLITGFPNVGKSSFMNKVTRADVEVQPYAFTTKSLFVGHTDYKYLRWQVIDTPGILDHPLEERNTIEMQSITALAHLRACVLYFMDISEMCGYSVQQQVSLFHNIKPLFVNKPLVLVLNKNDILKLADAPAAIQEMVKSVIEEGAIPIHCSTLNEEGVMEVKKTACDALLESRVETKLRSKKMTSVLSQLHLATPVTRDDLHREPVATPIKVDNPDRVLMRDIERSAGGPGVFNVNMKKNYLLKNEDWKFDVIPEIFQGKNIADFIDPNIEQKLLALEREEEELQKSGFYASDSDSNSDVDDDIKESTHALADEIRKARAHRLEEHRQKKALRKNRPVIPRTVMAQNPALADSEPLRGRKRARSESTGSAILDEIAQAPVKKVRSLSRRRDESGLRDMKQKMHVQEIANMAQRLPNRFARIGEADRAIPNVRPKHLLTGKRKMGKTDRR